PSEHRLRAAEYSPSPRSSQTEGANRSSTENIHGCAQSHSQRDFDLQHDPERVFAIESLSLRRLSVETIRETSVGAISSVCYRRSPEQDTRPNLRGGASQARRRRERQLARHESLSDLVLRSTGVLHD